MEAPLLVPAGTGTVNDTLDGREGDLSGINLDPSDGSFWAAAEYATQSTVFGQGSWGTAVADFTLGPAFSGSSDMAVTNNGPATVTAGGNATYTITLTNNGPDPGRQVTLTDALPSGLSYLSMTQTSGTDTFTLSVSGNTVTETADPVPSGNTDVFTLVAAVANNLNNGSTVSDTASVSVGDTDPNPNNNSSTVSSTVSNPNPLADLSVTSSGPSSSTEGNNITYTLTVNNGGPNDAQSVTLTDTLPTQVTFRSATSSQGTFTQSNGVVTFSMGTITNGGTATAKIFGVLSEDGSSTNTATVTTTNPDPNTNNNTATLTTSVAEPPINSTRPITFLGKTATNLRVATFAHANGVEPASAFTATINWGDGTTSPGTITQSGLMYNVTGSHTYARSGAYKITTTVTEIASDPSGFDGADSLPGGTRVVLPSSASVATASPAALGTSPATAPAPGGHAAAGQAWALTPSGLRELTLFLENSGANSNTLAADLVFLLWAEAAGLLPAG
jgi:uncharacterized repeat protein (TIGR01451 family)